MFAASRLLRKAVRPASLARLPRSANGLTWARAFCAASDSSTSAKAAPKPAAGAAAAGKAAAGAAGNAAAKPVDPTTDLTSLFNSMDYGVAPEAADYANAWLDSHDRKFGMFIDNEWVHPDGREYVAVTNPATGEKLAEVLQVRAVQVYSHMRWRRVVLCCTPHSVHAWCHGTLGSAWRFLTVCVCLCVSVCSCVCVSVYFAGQQ